MTAAHKILEAIEGAFQIDGSSEPSEAFILERVQQVEPNYTRRSLRTMLKEHPRAHLTANGWRLDPKEAVR